MSAEHGLGCTKNGLLPGCKDQIEIDIMRKIKHAFDPQCILNPYKLIPN